MMIANDEEDKSYERNSFDFSSHVVYPALSGTTFGNKDGFFGGGGGCKTVSVASLLILEMERRNGTEKWHGKLVCKQ